MAWFLDAYDSLVLKRPAITLSLIALIVAFFAYHAPAFRLDASADSLVLENDEALKYYRSIRARYGSDDYLIVTYSPARISSATRSSRTCGHYGTRSRPWNASNPSSACSMCRSSRVPP